MIWLFAVESRSPRRPPFLLVIHKALINFAIRAEKITDDYHASSRGGRLPSRSQRPSILILTRSPILNPWCKAAFFFFLHVSIIKNASISGYNGISDTTRILLNYWFYTDHRLPNGRKFAYHFFQREAVETLIYLYEVAKVRRHKNLVETFATRSNLRLLQYDEFARYCVKMATGSGKTRSRRQPRRSSAITPGVLRRT
jgi:hypothetical protein